MQYGSQDICYIAFGKGNSIELKFKFVTEKNLFYLILSLLAMLGSLSATGQSVGATANGSDMSPPVESNLSVTEETPQCPVTYRFDVESGLCVFGYTYCPKGVTLFETIPAECNEDLGGNTTSKNGFTNKSLTNFTDPHTG
jgi:hypothetical protein